MTWNTLTNLSALQVVSETHMDQLRENVEHLGAMLFGADAASALTAGSQLLYVVGTYTGDAAATKTISGIGFTPRLVQVWKQSNTNTLKVWKSSSSGTKSLIEYYGIASKDNHWLDDFIISLGSGQFVVGDGTSSSFSPAAHLNENAVVYEYIAWR